MPDLIKHFPVRMDVDGFQHIDNSGACIGIYNSALLGRNFPEASADELNKRKQTILTLHYMRMLINTVFDQVSLSHRRFSYLAQMAVHLIEDIEYSLQWEWGFDLDSRFHCYWYKIPHCTCPVMDNDDYTGTSMRSYAFDCPVHPTNLVDSVELGE